MSCLTPNEHLICYPFLFGNVRCPTLIAVELHVLLSFVIHPLSAAAAKKSS